MYVVLPDEDTGEGDEEMCGELLMSMYGTRDAALNWASEYSHTLTQSGYVQGQSNACLFYNPKTDVSILVHGDDFVAIGTDSGLTDVKDTLQNKYKLKVEVLGDGKGCTQEVRILNKIVRHTKKGIELEADPRHAEIVIRDLGIEGESRASRTPGAKDARTRGDKSSENDENAAAFSRISVITKEEYLA